MMYAFTSDLVPGLPASNITCLSSNSMLVHGQLSHSQLSMTYALVFRAYTPEPYLMFTVSLYGGPPNATFIAASRLPSTFFYRMLQSIQKTCAPRGAGTAQVLYNISCGWVTQRGTSRPLDLLLLNEHYDLDEFECQCFRLLRTSENHLRPVHQHRMTVGMGMKGGGNTAEWANYPGICFTSSLSIHRPF